MKKLFILMFVLLVSVKLAAQSDKVFHTYIYNDEFKVYMDINLYENNVIVPNQELFGETQATLELSATNANGLSLLPKLTARIRLLSRLPTTMDLKTSPPLLPLTLRMVHMCLDRRAAAA